MNEEQAKNKSISTNTTKKIKLSTTIIVASVTLVVGLFIGNNFSNLNHFLEDSSLTTGINSTPNWDKLNEVYSKLAANYNGDMDKSKLIEGAKKGMVESLGDIYTVYMDAEETEAFNNDLHGEIGGGIGIEFGQRDGYYRVLRTLPDNPARKAGILAGDIIYKVNDEDVTSLTSDEIALKTRGEAGTEVKITIIRDGKEKTFTMIREKINNVSAYITYDKKTAILTVTRFDIDTGTIVNNLAKEAIEKNCNKLILDLRNNGGGYVSAAQEVLSLWIDGEKILVQRSRKSTADDITYANHNKAILANIKTIVLVNESTASASEIVTGALKDYNKATIVGKKTYGKGVVQSLFDLSNNTSLKVTTASWYTPLGNSINKTGIEPDIEVDLTYDDTNNMRDPQLDKAKSL